MQKKTKIKILAATLILVLGVFLFALIYLNSRRFTEHAKLYITARVTRETGYPVRIDRVSTDIFTNMVLHGLRIFDSQDQDILLRASRVRIRFSLLNFIRNIRSLDKLVREISVDEPYIELIQDDLGLRIRGLDNINFESGGAPPPWRINLFNATVIYPDKDERITLSSLDSRISLAGYPEVSFRSSFALNDLSDEVRLDGDIHLVSRRVSTRLRTPRASLEKTLYYILGEETPEIRGGYYSADILTGFNLDGFSEPESLDLKLNGDLLLSNALYSEFLFSSARVSISPRRALLSEGIIEWGENKLDFAGSISDYLTDPYFDMRASGRTSAEDIFRAEGFDYLRGDMDISLKVEGKVEALEASAELFMESGEIYGIELRRFEAAAAYRDGYYELGSGSAIIGDGRLIWEGSFKPGGDIDMGFSASEIRLSRIGNNDISGNLSGSLFISGDSVSPDISSEIFLSDFSGFKREFDHVTFKTEISDSSLKLRAFSIDGVYTLELDGARRDDKVMLDSLMLRVSDKGLIRGEGHYRHPKGGSFSLSGEKIDIADIPELLQLYSDASGTVGFKSKVDLKEDSVMIISEIITDSFYIGDEQYSLKADISSLMHGREGRVSVKNFVIDDLIFGEIDLNIFPDGYSIGSSSFTAREASLSRLMSLLKLDIPLESELLSLDIYHADNTGAGSILIEELTMNERPIGNLSADLSIAQGEIFLDEFLLRKATGSLRASGLLFPEQRLEYNLTDYEYRERILSASGEYISRHVDGVYDLEAKADNIFIQGRRFYPLTLNLSRTPSIMSFNAASPRRMRWEGIIDYSNGGSVESELNIQGLSFGSLLEILGIEAFAEGEVYGSYRIIGDIDRPRVFATGRLEEIEYSGLPLRAGYDIEFGRDYFNVNEFRGRAAGGSLDISGGFSAGRAGVIVSLKGVDLSYIGRISDRKLGGLIDLSADISGIFDKPYMTINASGKDMKLLDSGVRSFNADLKIEDRDITLTSGRVFFQRGDLGLSGGSITLNEDSLEFSSNVLVNNLRAGPVGLIGRTSLNGSISYEPFNLGVNILPGNLLLNRLPVRKKLSVNYSPEGFSAFFEEGLKIAGRIEEDRKLIIDEVTTAREDASLGGNVFISDEGYEVNLRGAGIELERVMQLLNRQELYSGLAEFSIRHAGGNMGDGGALRLSVREGKYAGLDIGNIEADIDYSKGEIKVNGASFYGTDLLDVSVSGLLGEKSDLVIHMSRFSLAFAESFMYEFAEASGNFEGRFHITGDISNPEISGSADLKSGEIRGRSMFDKITGIQASLEASGSKVHINDIRGTWRPGRVYGGGSLDISSYPFILALNLNTRNTGVAVKVPRLDIPQSTLFGRLLTLPSYGEPRFDLNFSNTPEGVLYVRGDIILQDTHFTYPPSRPAVDRPGGEAAFDTYYDITFIAGESVWYENTFARLKVDGELNLRVPPTGRMIANGLLESSQGTVSFLNREFSIDQASLSFENSVEHVYATGRTEVNRRMDGDWVEDVIELTIPQSRIADIQPVFGSSRFRESTSGREALEAVIAETSLREMTQEERTRMMRREFLRAIDANLTSPLVKNLLTRMDLVDTARVDVRLAEDAETDEFILESAGIRLGRSLTDRIHLDYYMQMGSNLRLFNEFDLTYRLKGSQFLRGTIDEERRFYLGLEHRIRF